MQSKEAVAERWFVRILRTYPCGTARFFHEERDPFRNPVGHAFKEALGILVDELLLDMNSDRIAKALESIVQIRAVQDFSPGQALAFIFELKEIVSDEGPGPALDLIYSRIDDIALLAFDLYVKYREKICEARADEAKRRVYVLERAMASREGADWRERGGA